MQRRIFLNIAAVLLLGAIICGLLSARVVEKTQMDSIEESLVVEAGLVRELAGESLINGSGIKEHISKIETATNSRITVIDADGNVLADTEEDFRTMDNHSGRPEFAAALSGQPGRAIRHSDTLEVDLMYIAQPIYKDGRIIGAVRLAKPLYEINSLLRKLYVSIFVGVAAGILAATLLGYKMAARITKPIEDITYTASKIAKGQFDKRLNITSRDEIGILAASINDMAARLNDTIISLQDKNIKLEAIMSSVVNGIVAIDSSERVLFINSAAERLLGITEADAAGKHLLQVVRNNAIDNYLKAILRDKNYFETEVTIEHPVNKVLKLYSNPIRHSDSIDGIILTLQDITELRKLEKVRTDFVANVSHEMRTPLTSIKGFAETLKMGDIEEEQDRLRFLGIIEDEADRLCRLINDLLSLSELEQKKTKVKQPKEEIKVEKAIREVLSMLESQSEKKHIELTLDVQEGLHNITGEADKFKQMLINLVDNAIKYTPENGKVRVEAYNHEDGTGHKKLIIKVIDNGIGIPKQHLPRLFERFYRVDKARSRAVGGTGLGLAIVKHIALLLDGEVEVDSEVGKGTEFRVILPV